MMIYITIFSILLNITLLTRVRSLRRSRKTLTNIEVEKVIRLADKATDLAENIQEKAEKLQDQIK